MVGKVLQITRFSIDGKVAAAKVKDGRISLPSHPDGTHVRMDYEGVFSDGEGRNVMNLIGANGAFLVGGWYPAAEAERAHFALEARVPEGFQGVSEAESITTHQTAEGRLQVFHFPHPVPHINFVMAPYIITKDRHGDVEVATYLLPEDKDLSNRYLAYIKKYLRMYENMLGPYPFRRFAVVENILPTGYGMPTFTLLGQQVLKLNELVAEFFERQLAMNPIQATQMGDDRFDDQWANSLAPDHIAKRRALDEEFLARLGEIDPAALDRPPDRVVRWPNRHPSRRPRPTSRPAC